MFGLRYSSVGLKFNWMVIHKFFRRCTLFNFQLCFVIFLQFFFIFKKTKVMYQIMTSLKKNKQNWSPNWIKHLINNFFLQIKVKISSQYMTSSKNLKKRVQVSFEYRTSSFSKIKIKINCVLKHIFFLFKVVF